MSIAAYHVKHLDNIVCVVGLGLIGKATDASLSLFGTKIHSCPNIIVNWNDPNSIFEGIRLATNHSTRALELIWCAGKYGFSATDLELAIEYNVFKDVIELLTECSPNIAVSFISSAGGLYEGSGGKKSPTDYVNPIRPYGKWKLKQEQLLQERVTISRIYRVSSVYGLARNRSRYGLVNALIESTYTNSPALIYAQGSTLRDYVSSPDVGKYLVSQLVNDSSSVEIIASGRPTSIDMLANLVKRVIRRNLKISYRSGTKNDKDIIFSQKYLAKKFACCSLEEGISNLSSTYREIKFSGTRH